MASCACVQEITMLNATFSPLLRHTNILPPPTSATRAPTPTTDNSSPIQFPVDQRHICSNLFTTATDTVPSSAKAGYTFIGTILISYPCGRVGLGIARPCRRKMLVLAYEQVLITCAAGRVSLCPRDEISCRSADNEGLLASYVCIRKCGRFTYFITV